MGKGVELGAGQPCSPRQADCVQSPFCCCFAWVFLKAAPETRIWMQAVYLGGDPSTVREQERETRKGRKPVQVCP